MGFTAIIGECEEHRGGAALFLDAESRLLDLNEMTTGTYLGGRLVTASLRAEGHPIEVASVYVPAGPYARGAFLCKLKELGAISSNTILQGDFNYVPDVLRDVRYPAGSTTTYANAHAGAYERWLADRGLKDIYRQFHGTRAVQFTRQAETVWTRLDRFYARETSATWTTVSIDIDANYCRTKWSSDHLALSMRLAPLGDSKAKQGRKRIDPEMLYDTTVREMITQLWHRTYSRYPTTEYGHAHTWQHFKVELRRLLTEYGSWRDDPNEDVKAEIVMLKNARQALAQEVKGSAPSKEHCMAMERLAHRIKETATKLRPARGWQALQKVLREETPSKAFFSRFRTRHANQNINEMYACEDWADADRRPYTDSPTVTDDTSILEEARRYYQHLFRRRDPVDPERLYAKLDKRRITSTQKAKLDQKIGEPEVRRAIRSMGNGKSPGLTEYQPSSIGGLRTW